MTRDNRSRGRRPGRGQGRAAADQPQPSLFARVMRGLVIWGLAVLLLASIALGVAVAMAARSMPG